jgi:hypothetical protein
MQAGTQLPKLVATRIITLCCCLHLRQSSWPEVGSATTEAIQRKGPIKVHTSVFLAHRFLTVCRARVLTQLDMYAQRTAIQPRHAHFSAHGCTRFLYKRASVTTCNATVSL